MMGFSSSTLELLMVALGLMVGLVQTQAPPERTRVPEWTPAPALMAALRLTLSMVVLLLPRPSRA